MTTFDPAYSYIRNPDLIAAAMDGDLVMMSIARGEYFGVGGIGPRVWELLEQPMTLERITQSICAEYEVDAATCGLDLADFLETMLEMDLVRVQ